MKLNALLLGSCAFTAGKSLKKLSQPEQDTPIIENKISGLWWAAANRQDSSVTPTEAITIYNINYNVENSTDTTQVCSGKITNDVVKLSKIGLKSKDQFLSFNASSTWLESNKMNYNIPKYTFDYTLPSSTHSWEFIVTGGYPDIHECLFMSTYPINDYSHHTYFSMVPIHLEQDKEFIDVIDKECNALKID
jgi:hypothetical protein